MPEAAREALLQVYQNQVDWLLELAAEFESGARKASGRIGENEVDLSSNFAAEFRHRAGNMQAILQAYDRLHMKNG